MKLKPAHANALDRSEFSATNPEDPNNSKKMRDYSETLIQQIDTMNAAVSAFSNFASMPAQQNETLNVVEVVELTLDIFNEHIVFESDYPEIIISKIDRTQLIRIITNLVKNAIQPFQQKK
jgi:nitrogen fixation/metabolism regulation signal transduction histidine kinase